jgi:uncharacterized protein (TIGR02118 family)
MKLIALYKQPPDPIAFDNHYTSTHMPLLEKVPGLEKTILTKFSRTLVGEGFYMMAEMIFPDADTFKAAMKSSEMAATGEDINTFAPGLLTLMIGAET